MRMALRYLLALATILTSTSISFASPDRGTKANYGGVCNSEDAVYVQGKDWWRFEFGIGPGTGWQKGGTVTRINGDQVIIENEVYTRIGSQRDNCRPL